jgi:hypothetical protein
VTTFAEDTKNWCHESRDVSDELVFDRLQTFKLNAGWLTIGKMMKQVPASAVATSSSSLELSLEAIAASATFVNSRLGSVSQCVLVGSLPRSFEVQFPIPCVLARHLRMTKQQNALFVRVGDLFFLVPPCSKVWLDAFGFSLDTFGVVSKVLVEKIFKTAENALKQLLENDKRGSLDTEISVSPSSAAYSEGSSVVVCSFLRVREMLVSIYCQGMKSNRTNVLELSEKLRSSIVF